MDKVIYVHAGWLPLEAPQLIGALTCEVVRSNEVFRFEYDKDWLASKHCLMFDPELSLHAGVHHKLDGTNNNFRSFLDSCPDRWGQKLMRQREAIVARQERRRPNKLLSSDYLLGVHDMFRMGGLRFSLKPSGPYLDDTAGMASPHISALRELAYAAKQLEENEDADDASISEWLRLLIVPGGSLGGARPKAGIIDESGVEWIAKFPGANDDRDVALWEHITYEMAIDAGIEMEECRVEKLGHHYHTFITKRFDRRDGARLHFTSAMTQLERYDGDEGASYLDIVEFITQSGRDVKADLAQLWRRIVFSIAVSNTDDHLRNHGFMLANDRGRAEWRLSPAYDINPSVDKDGLHLNIDEDDNALDFSLAFEVAEFFQLDEAEAADIYNQVVSAVSNWRERAIDKGISRAEILEMEAAFNV